MKSAQFSFKSIYVLAFIFFVSCTNTQDAVEVHENKLANTKDPLPSWNDGTLKTAIINFVKEAADSNSKNFIPVINRIATFDNDGTLWAEKPLVQELFALHRISKMIKEHPELAKKQPFKAVLEKDANFFKKGSEKALIDLVIASHTGMSEDVFEKEVTDFMTTGIYPPTGKHFQNIIYQPQLELLNYLRTNGFKTFICSGGTIEFIRVFSQDFYGIPKEQVIGTSFKYQYVDSNKTIQRLSALNSFDDKAGKPVNIQLHIGQRPVFACGNIGAGGDIAMLQYSQSSKFPSFQMLLNHTDSTREFFYQEKDSASLKAANQNKWHVINMKDDWKTVYKN
jgi:hypothetical protein